LDEVFFNLPMKLEAIHQIFLSHPKVTTDSRNIEPDSIFFALKGDQFNGNLFALSAIEKGASYAIVDDNNFAVHPNILLVENVLQTLQDLARLHRQRMGIPILAITGTNGKTTTKELTAAVLAKKFNLVATRGNLNNHIGVPLTLLRITAATEFGVIEMGANHPGEIDELCRIALPDCGLITNVGSAHLEGFGSFEGVIQTKTELYRFLEQHNGTVFINNSNAFLTNRIGSANTVGYTISKTHSGLEGEIVNTDPFLVFKASFPKGWLYIKTNLVGSYNLENALAAAAIGQHFGIDPLEIAVAIEGYQPDNNRSQMVVTERNRLLMDAYNANPSSTRAALENFATLKAPKKGVILGDMLELGIHAQEEHQRITDFLATMELDLVLLSGPNYSGCKLPNHFQCFENSTVLADRLKEECLSGYLLLIKGSRGMKLETIKPEL
jgi:UDP-N-acetylmuramoyl-tripeptide--D-alanyl-D-alanine ligase